jgi:PLP dependent protein
MNSAPGAAYDGSSVAERLADVRARLDAAAHAAGRDPADVHLVAVTKGFPVEAAFAAFDAGARDLGENRVQELVPKIDAFEATGRTVRWHLIGTLQRNKVKYVAGRVAMIHSIDDRELLAEVSARSAAKDFVTDVLLQVNVSGEATKHGFDASECPGVLRAARGLAGVRVRGLMTMAPLSDDPATVRPVFEGLAALQEQLRAGLDPEAAAAFDVLSMGMSHDFETAVACGATHVRIGTAVFGERPPRP